ncbi:mitochondrial 54S ribosomal protein bL12m Ecym_2204 [Eremothecium cymbalariae DBVPG|uniref:Ribosomal protein L7/L12 C-terminal domain-containing protein n=1 Tax=Eremothecium cymbalariae (strain CBS 270.75 / DBVPG 7215 / KCTC 17166 / NRRL Y-17582) TaxID=931890 RepID=G8JP48_ERECY|nr:Hypothetical protein Ecym_2204 [Eremothecium cymbalariae DBVPG\
MLRQVTRPYLALSRCSQLTRQFVRLSSTTTEESSRTDAVDPKISSIVKQISQLSLLETSTLISELKSQLNIPDISFPVGGAAPAAQSAGASEEAKEEEVKEDKTIFSIKIESFDAKSKPKVIKEVKSLLGLSLVEAKKFVEAAPKILKENVAKEEADKIKATLEGLGAKISLE